MKINNKIAILLMLSLSLLIIGCRADSSRQIDQQSVKSPITANQNAKPVIFILVDSLMDKPLQDAIQEGRAPAMQYLLKNGQYFPQVVSSFPTMSVTVDSTLLTGTYADQHHVPGLVWYSGKEKRMIFYGNGAKEALKIDQLQVFKDAIYQLNQVQLNKKTKTIHEELADKGKESASINAIVYRGKTEHALKVPRFITSSNRVPEQLIITGPKWFSYAALAQLDPKNSWNTLLWKKYGMNNEFSAQDTAFLINQKKLPNVTIAYFPENDHSVHKKGPTQLDGIEKADQALQVVLNAYGSWEQAVKNAIWIVMGDSAQSAVYEDRQAATVEMKPLLNDYHIAKLNQPVRTEDQIVISTNERMAYVYAIDAKVELSDVVKLLQNEDKLDIIAMKDDKNIRVTSGKNGNTFSYRPGGNLSDEYGQSWTLSGEPGGLVDITINNNRIKYGIYPDVLARLYGAMHSHEGRYVVVTVQPGYELVSESSPTHIGGGAHGSLHEKDSLVPLIISGTNTRPKTLRIVDIKDWILQLVNG
ncbi:Type I phosphodiesterase / nucleotide pyrophosphatase [Paenibacillus algorifonticola]|uniref:Type I phosphodiesterase / nucleotide pyrophosphatase n=1 Tax=Paenibacillus algorifonticola TaxID=684063 RepID=A0A1I1Y5J3_9BACL|nr:alkaline phosphatase family protein [Paenibacillus algorifonticola]SFE14861.1 Type I phosphodiesterase / nucleotide pyrophosphatase [Paenibacillus algorifonticola]